MLKNATPRPFLKWAGGKGQLLGELLARVDAAGPFKNYFEPFVGGGALFFALARMGRLGSRARLSDINQNILDAYLGVRDDVDSVISMLKIHANRHCKEHFYEVRSEVPGDLTGRAARFIYLNRTCFNGLYRENSKGRFNVPFGRYRNPRICDEENLKAVARVLKHTRIENKPFEKIQSVARAGDFVYFDPPYHPVSKTASFTSYDRNGFGEDSQRKLAEVYANLSSKGVHVLLSNSMTPFVVELYRDFKIDEVYATRSVNSRTTARGAVPEALVRNF